MRNITRRIWSFVLGGILLAAGVGIGIYFFAAIGDPILGGGAIAVGVMASALISCLFLGKDALFTGDTLMADGGYGRTDLPGSSPSALQDSLRRIFTLLPSLRIYPGHGGVSTLADEKRFHFF